MAKPDKLLGVTEASFVLGLSIFTIRRLTNSGALPCMRAGGLRQRIFKLSELEAFKRRYEPPRVGRPPHVVVAP